MQRGVHIIAVNETYIPTLSPSSLILLVFTLLSSSPVLALSLSTMANAAFRSALLSVLLLTAPHGVVLAQTCVAAPPQAGFAPSDYTGVWYEIGKIQTAGGAIFESSCVCTQLIVAAAADPVAPGDATVLNSCRDKTPQGAFINASAQLVNMAPPGHWDETFVPPAWKCVRRQSGGSVTRG